MSKNNKFKRLYFRSNPKKQQYLKLKQGNVPFMWHKIDQISIEMIEWYINECDRHIGVCVCAQLCDKTQ